MHPDLPPSFAPLEIDRVEWVPASPEAVRVHLLGRWIDRPVAEPLVLLVGTERGRRPFEALAEAPAEVLAAFAVPNELRGRLEVDIALQIGARELPLPAAAPGAVATHEPPVPGSDAEVIDRAVLAERRARRAELAEESLAHRAAEAEQTTRTLEAQLGNLEEQLARAREERDELRAELTDAEHGLRAAQQREYAEQQSRIRAQDELDSVRPGPAAEVDELRRRLDAAHGRAEAMAAEVDRARARVGALEHELEGRAALQARIVEGLAALRTELERRKAVGDAELTVTRMQLEEARAAAAGGSELRAALDHERRAFAAQVTMVEERVRALREELSNAWERLRETVEAERDARRQAELLLGAERAATADALARLAAEQARREELAADVAGALGAVRALRVQDASRGAREAVLRGLVAEVLEIAASLRTSFERERRRSGAEAPGPAQEAEPPKRERVPEGEAEQHAGLEDELTLLRAELQRVERLTAEQTARTHQAEVMIADLTSAAERLRENAEPPGEEDGGEGPEILRPRVSVGAEAEPAPWLAQAIVRLTAHQPEAAGRLAERLLPVQGLRCSEPLVYDLTLTGVGSFRISLGEGPAVVARQAEPGPEDTVDFHLTGTAAQVATIVAGSAGRRRARGTGLSGSRRALRRLLKAQRRPVTLAEVHRSGASLEAELVLRALAVSVEPEWTGERAFTVAFAVSGPSPQTWSVSAGPRGAEVSPGLPEGGATATVSVAEDMLLPLLGGFLSRSGESATATGDPDVVVLLRQWFDRAQGLS